MDSQQYQRWVEYVINNGFIKPQIIIDCINNYDRWQSRLSLARYLMHEDYRQYGPALEILEDVIEKHLNRGKYQVDTDDCLSLEEKVWVLRDSAKLQWQVNKDYNKALDYISKALRLIHMETLQSRIVSGGEIWRQKLEILRELDRRQEALLEIKMMKNFKKDKALKSNSYLFNAYYFRSILYMDQGDTDSALNSMKQALNYFPLYLIEGSYEKLRKIWEERYKDSNRTYNSMIAITKHRVFWEV